MAVPAVVEPDVPMFLPPVAVPALEPPALVPAVMPLPLLSPSPQAKTEQPTTKETIAN
jgi:hypothetical protein